MNIHIRRFLYGKIIGIAVFVLMISMIAVAGPYYPIFVPIGLLIIMLSWISLQYCRDIHKAAKAGDLEKVKALLNHNPKLICSKDNDGIEPLCFAAHSGNEKAIELLLAHGANINAKDRNGLTPLHIAAKQGYNEVAELLLAKGADINARDDDDYMIFSTFTPLHRAAIEGHKNMVELLLSKGAEVNAVDDGGSTPLSWAVSMGHNDVAELLRQHGGHE